MAIDNQIKVGDTVVIISDLINNLSFKRYIVENIYETGNKNYPYQFSYILKDSFRQYYRDELQHLSTSPFLKIRITDGEYDTYKSYIVQNKKYLDSRNINMDIGSNDSNLVTIEFNFENIVDLYYLSSDIGRFIQLDEQGIKEREALSLQKRINSMKEEINNKESRYPIDNDHAREGYDTDGMKYDDEYNFKNWEGHDD